MWKIIFLWKICVLFFCVKNWKNWKIVCVENSEKFGKFLCGKLFCAENFGKFGKMENLENLCPVFCVENWCGKLENLENSLCVKFGKWKNLENFKNFKLEKLFCVENFSCSLLALFHIPKMQLVKNISSKLKCGG